MPNDSIYQIGSAPFTDSQTSATGAHIFKNQSGTTIMSLTATGVGRFPNGAVGAPGIAFTNETDCGLYVIGTNNIGFSAAGAKVLDISATGLGVVGTTLGGNGTVALPAFSFTADPDSGMYRIGANNIGISVNEAKVLDISATGLGVTGTMLSGDGTVSLPGIGFSSDTDNGLYRIGANNIGMALGGSKLLDMTDATLALTSANKSGGASALTVTPGAHVAVTAEVFDVSVATHTNTVTGAITLQRFTNFASPTITAATAQTVTTAATVTVGTPPNPTGAGPATITNAFSLMIGTSLTANQLAAASASTTITTAAALYIAAAPAVNTNVAITNSYAIYCNSGAIRNDGNMWTGQADSTFATTQPTRSHIFDGTGTAPVGAITTSSAIYSSTTVMRKIDAAGNNTAIEA